MAGGAAQAIVFVRPTLANLELLSRELDAPNFSEYHLCTPVAARPVHARLLRELVAAVFTNIVSEEMLKRVAEADVHESVKQVQEYFGDFYALSPSLFAMNLENSLQLGLAREGWDAGQERMFDRAVGVRARRQSCHVVLP